MMHDAAIARLLMRSLLKDQRVSSQHVQASVQDGYVTIRGRVRTAGERAVAGELASTIPGAFAVLNELRIVPPAALPDATVAENLRTALEGDPRVVKESITVSVAGGVVTLSGTVRGVEERLVVLDIALGSDGVRDVKDLLHIDVVRRVEDAMLARDVKSAIVVALPDTASHVRVAVSEGMAVLSGQVTTDALRHLAEAVASQFPLTGLRNEIVVAVPSHASVDLDAQPPRSTSHADPQN